MGVNMDMELFVFFISLFCVALSGFAYGHMSGYSDGYKKAKSETDQKKWNRAIKDFHSKISKDINEYLKKRNK